MNRKGKPSGPHGHWLWGNGREYRENPLDFLQQISQTYGDIVQLRLGPFEGYLINHPDLIKQVLVDEPEKVHKPSLGKRMMKPFLGNGILMSDGDFYQKQRQLVLPAFHYNRIETYGQIMVKHTLEVIRGWADGAVVDVEAEMMKITLRVVAETLFGTDISRDEGRVGAAMETIQEEFGKRMGGLPIDLGWLPTPGNLARRKAIAELDRIVREMIHERRACGEDRGDLLSMLLLARDESGEGMPDRQVRDEVMTIFIAGHETTAVALSWLWYLLARHPEIQRKLVDEVDRVVGNHHPKIADLKQMPHTEMAVKEALRLYPPVWFYARDPITEMNIGGYCIPRTARLYLAPYAIQRDPRYFNAPNQFIPERWGDRNAAGIPKYAYFPFSSGPRICVGNTFAMLEARLVVATILQHVRMTLIEGQEIVPAPQLTLRSKNGIKIHILHRNEPVHPGYTFAERQWDRLTTA